MSGQRRREQPKTTSSRGGRKFGGPKAPRKPGRPGKTGKGLDPKSLKDKVDFERWKIERKKQSDKPAKPLGKMKKPGPKPGTFEYQQLNYLLKPGYRQRKGMKIGGRANLLEEMGRIDSEKMNPNRRAEKRRVISELNRGYNKGGTVKKVAKLVAPFTPGYQAIKAATKLIKGLPKIAKKGWK